MDLFNLRRDFSLKTLSEKDISPHPIDMLKLWLDEAIQAEALEPTAMMVSTVNAEGRPSSRIVLVKEISEEGLAFFTNYNSRKGHDIASNNYVALNFMWHELERQVRIEGTIEKLSEQASDKYFAMRPRDSQIGAWASPQSQTIPSRDYLDNKIKETNESFDGKDNIDRPIHWGGYLIKPTYFEFWQGRKNRLHDRIQYQEDGKDWKIGRLAP